MEDYKLTLLTLEKVMNNTVAFDKFKQIVEFVERFKTPLEQLSALWQIRANCYEYTSHSEQVLVGLNDNTFELSVKMSLYKNVNDYKDNYYNDILGTLWLESDIDVESLLNIKVYTDLLLDINGFVPQEDKTKGIEHYLDRIKWYYAIEDENDNIIDDYESEYLLEIYGGDPWN